MLDAGEGAGDEVQQWALLQEGALGPRRHSRRRIPCAPRFQDGDIVELDSVQLFLSSHDRPEMKVSTSYFHRIRYESVPTRNPWGLSPPAGMVAKSGLSSPSALLGASGLASPAPSSSVIGIFTPCSPPSAACAPPSYGNGILMERRKPLGVYVEQTFLSSVETQGSHFIYVLFIFFPFCTFILVGELICQCGFESF